MLEIDNKSYVFDVAKRLLAYMAESATHTVEDNSTVDPREFTDQQRFIKEKAELFRQTPLLLGFSNDLPESGSFMLNEDLDVSVLLTRTADGQVKAFLNACSHRGAKLTEEPCGNRGRFTCPYHAWSYSNEGELLAINQHSDFGNIEKSDLGLVEFPCAEKYGMIFVVLDPEANLDIDTFLGSDSVDYLSGWHFERNTLAAQRDLVTDANWKIALDTFCEGYHFPVLHAKDFAYKVDYCAYHWRFGPNGRNWAVAWPSESLEDLRNKPESKWGNPQEHFSIIHYIYPNTIIGIYPETCSMWNIYPGDDVHSQITRMRFYSRLQNASDEEKEIISGRLELFYKVLQQEDYWISSGIYENVRSGLLPRLIIGRNEPGPAWVHQALNDGLQKLTGK